MSDVAEAFCALLDSEVPGPVNIASRRPAAVRELIEALAAKAEGEGLIQWGAIPPNRDEPPLLVAGSTGIHRSANRKAARLRQAW